MCKDKIKRKIYFYFKSVIDIAFFVFIGVFAANALTVLEQYKGPVIEASKVEVLSSDAAVVIMRMRAEKILEYENGDKEYPEGVYMEFYEGDSVTSTLKANKAYYYSKTGLYKGEGDVEIKIMLRKNNSTQKNYIGILRRKKFLQINL